MSNLNDTIEQLDREIGKKRHQEMTDRTDMLIALMASLQGSVDNLNGSLKESSAYTTQTLGEVFHTVAREQSAGFDEAIAFLGDDIRSIQIEPKVNVAAPVVNVPPFKIPEIKVNVPAVKIPTIKVPKPEVTVNVPKITIPKIEVPDVIMPDFMRVTGSVGLTGVDKKNPLPVYLTGSDVASAISGGGKADYFTIKAFGESAFSVPVNSDGEVKVSGTFVAGAPASTYVIAGNAEGLAYNSDNPLPVYLTSGASATSAVNIVDSSAIAYSGSNPLPVTLVSGGTATTGAQLLNADGLYRDTLPVSGTVIVSGVSSSISAALIDSSGIQYSGTNPVPVSGAFYQATQPVSGTFWQATQPVSGTVAVSGVTASISAALTDSSGIQYSGTNPLPTTDGFDLPLYDYMSLAETSGTDVYTYKRGGAGGTTVGTLTIVYVDDTRLTISTVTRT